MPDSLYLILCIIGLGTILACWTYTDWQTWNEYRKLERRAHLNTMKAGQR
jgi:hypothetical protein